MIAVMSVIKNRADHASRRWPNSISNVVKQGCEFSYRCDGSMRKDKNKKEWEKAKNLAYEFMINPNLHKDKESLFYHKKGLTRVPKWARIHTHTREVGNHLFFDCSTKYC